MPDFPAEKAKAEGKCKGADTTAEATEAGKKYGPYQAAAKAYVELADLWKPHNLVKYEENMQEAAKRRRLAAADTANVADKSSANDQAGKEESLAADELMKLGKAAQDAKDPAGADAFYKKAKQKYDTAKADFNNAGKPASAATANAEAAKAQAASDAVQKFIK